MLPFFPGTLVELWNWCVFESTPILFQRDKKYSVWTRELLCIQTLRSKSWNIFRVYCVSTSCRVSNEMPHLYFWPKSQIKTRSDKAESSFVMFSFLLSEKICLPSIGELERFTNFKFSNENVSYSIGIVFFFFVADCEYLIRFWFGSDLLARNPNFIHEIGKIDFL